MSYLRDLDFIAAHLAGDFLLQTAYQAAHKLTDPKVRARHVGTYLIPFAAVAVLRGVPAGRIALFLSLYGPIHYLTDSRRWLKTDAPTGVQIAADQSLHAVQIALLAPIINHGGTSADL